MEEKDIRNSVSTFSKGEEATESLIHASTFLNDSLSYGMLPSVFDGPDTSAKPHVSKQQQSPSNSWQGMPEFWAARTAKFLCD